MLKAFDSNLLKLNFAYILLGFTALFGEFLHELSPAIITLGRTVFASIFLVLLIVLSRRKFTGIQKSHLLGFAAAGLLLSFHWVAFFQSVQLGSVAIAVLTFTTFPIFSAFLEPIAFKEPFSLKNIALSSLCLVGIFFVVPDFNPESATFQGVIWGVVAGFTFSVLSLFNRSLVKSYNNDVLTFYQLAFAGQCIVASFVLFPVGAEVFFELSIYEVLMLVLLGVLFTAIPHMLVISSLRYVKVQSVGILSTLEPVYGIIFAWILLDEIITIKTLIGGSIIIFAVFLLSKNKATL